MPRFRIVTLLIVLAVVALWLSTFAAYTAADDVRKFIILTIVICSGAIAVYSTAERRAFWGGFFVTLFAMGAGGNFLAHKPRLTWLTSPSRSLAQYISDDPNPIEWKQNIESVTTTLFLLLWIFLAAMIGLLCVYIYKQTHRADES